MPLIPIILEKGFRDIIESPPKSPIDTANKISNMYADYAKLAVAAGPVAFSGAEAKRMAGVMAAGFNSYGAPPMAAGAIVRSITAFWLAPPVPFAAGVTVSWAGGPALLSCLASNLSNPKISSGAAAKILANCFDTASRLVLVQPFAPGAPIPIG